MKIQGLSGVANLLGIAFLAIALVLALTSPATVGAAPSAQTTATETVAATPMATATAVPSTLPTTGAADQSLALGLMVVVGLSFLGTGLALRAFAPKKTQ